MDFKKTMDKAIRMCDEKKKYEFFYWNSMGSGHFSSKVYKADSLNEAQSKFNQFANKVQASLSGLEIYENDKLIKKDSNWRNY